MRRPTIALDRLLARYGPDTAGIHAQAWSFTMRGDIGGFGIGSDFAWQGVGTLRWQASDSRGVLAAYRCIDMDYDNGRNKDGKYFEYDMALAGPAIGFVFTF